MLSIRPSIESARSDIFYAQYIRLDRGIYTVWGTSSGVPILWEWRNTPSVLPSFDNGRKLHSNTGRSQARLRRRSGYVKQSVLQSVGIRYADLDPITKRYLDLYARCVSKIEA